MKNVFLRNAVSQQRQPRALKLMGTGLALFLMLAGSTVIGVLPAGAANAASMSFTSGPSTPQTAGVGFSATVTVASGGSAGDTIKLSSNNCTLDLNSPSTVSATLGTEPDVLTFSNIIVDTGTSCNLIATDQQSGGNTTSSSFALDPNTASSVAFTTAPATVGVYGVALPSFAVSVEDTYGNVETGSNPGNNDEIDITSTNCTLSNSPVVVHASGGIATFTNDVVITAGSSCTLTATDTTVGVGDDKSSAAIAMTSDTPALLAFTTEPASSPIAGTALSSFAVSIEASNGGVTNFDDVIALTSSCKLSGTTIATAVSGVATFSGLVIDSTGSCYLTATDSSRTLATATSSPMVVQPGAPTHLAFVTAPPTTVNGTGITLSTFEVGVEDAFGNIETTGVGFGDTIVLSSTCGLSGTTSVVASAGLATFSTVSFTTTGACTLTATDSTRTLTTATASIEVGEPQATLTVSTTAGYLDSPLTLATKGGSGTGAVTYSVTNGTATGCAITNGALSATTAGTCIVTATKAAASPYASASSAATTVTISSAPKALRLIGTLTIGKTATVTVTGYNFSGRPRAISNVGGFSALVIRDSGKILTIRISVKVTATKPGVKTMTLIFANGKRTSFKYSLH